MAAGATAAMIGMMRIPEDRRMGMKGWSYLEIEAHLEAELILDLLGEGAVGFLLFVVLVAVGLIAPGEGGPEFFAAVVKVRADENGDVLVGRENEVRIFRADAAFQAGKPVRREAIGNS